MSRLPKKELKKLFETIVSEHGWKCGKANPFVLQKEKSRCFVFIKNISPAYYVNYPDNSRVQLPASDLFREVIESDLDFIILGYDDENQVFVSWNPFQIKDRLNERANVSLYSRFSWQTKVQVGLYMHRQLGNQEKIVLFKKDLLSRFFESYKNLFDNKDSNGVQGSLDDKLGVDVESIQNLVYPLLKEHKVLKAISVLQESLKDKKEYRGFSFSDYFDIVNEIYKSMN